MVGQCSFYFVAYMQYAYRSLVRTSLALHILHTFDRIRGSCRGVCADASLELGLLGGGGDGLLKVGDDIVDVLDADRDAHKVLGHARG